MFLCSSKELIVNLRLTKWNICLNSSDWLIIAVFLILKLFFLMWKFRIWFIRICQIFHAIEMRNFHAIEKRSKEVTVKFRFFTQAISHSCEPISPLPLPWRLNENTYSNQFGQKHSDGGEIPHTVAHSMASQSAGCIDTNKLERDGADLHVRVSEILVLTGDSDSAFSFSHRHGSKRRIRLIEHERACIDVAFVLSISATNTSKRFFGNRHTSGARQNFWVDAAHLFGDNLRARSLVYCISWKLFVLFLFSVRISSTFCAIYIYSVLKHIFLDIFQNFPWRMCGEAIVDIFLVFILQWDHVCEKIPTEQQLKITIWRKDAKLGEFFFNCVSCLIWQWRSAKINKTNRFLCNHLFCDNFLCDCEQLTYLVHCFSPYLVHFLYFFLCLIHFFYPYSVHCFIQFFSMK